MRLPTLVALFSTLAQVRAGPCIAFDTNWNLLAFGLNGKDYNAGTSDKWASGSATNITSSGRPPFDGGNTRCYLAQFFNAIYVVDGDAANPNNLHIYDAGKKSWSTQSMTPNDFDPTSFEAILDHDTNLFYAISKGNLYSAEMAELTAAQSNAIPWTPQGAVEIDVSSPPVMSIAQNHIQFFGVPGSPAGSVPIFVIHFAFWQAGAQPMGDFPTTHGRATSLFLDSGVQQEMVFVPDDGSQTYIVNVESNTTQTMAGPSTKDADAFYFASINEIVQLASNGAVSWIPYSASDKSANSNAKWSSVANLASVAPPSSGGSPSGAGTSASGSAGGSKTTGGGAAATNKASNTASGTSPSGTGGAIRHTALGLGSALGLLGVAFSLL
ncbi:hypothetical protein MKEN_00517700 [Mycena kentingensis (nom. inval.)]|nr:hypothetical protein MKEN_00517700 [Mycena kentingensis (nom. inval.)]